MILNIFDEKNDSSINTLKKTSGIKLIRKYLPNIDANMQGYIVTTVEEWEQIQDKFPQTVTCRTDTKVGTEIPNVHGTTQDKQYISDYIRRVLQIVEHPYFICLELEPGSNERIYTQGGLVLEVNIGQDIIIGYVGPGFDCGELTKGVAEHETWRIPWDKNAIKRKDGMDKYRIHKISQSGYAQTALKRMAFLIKEYPERKQEIMDVLAKRYHGITPELFAKLQEDVLIPLWEKQEELSVDGLQHFGVELNVVEGNKLVPFEIETPEVFRTKNMINDSVGRNEVAKQKSKSSFSGKNMIPTGNTLLKKYLPNLIPMSSQSSHNVEGGFNIAIYLNDCIIIELARKDYCENDIDEAYTIPWSEVLFIRDKSDLMKSRSVEKVVPADKTQQVNSSVIDSILSDIVFNLYKRKNELIWDGLSCFSIKGDIEDSKIIPLELFRPERVMSRENVQER